MLPGSRQGACSTVVGGRRGLTSKDFQLLKIPGTSSVPAFRAELSASDEMVLAVFLDMMVVGMLPFLVIYSHKHFLGVSIEPPPTKINAVSPIEFLFHSY